MTDTPTHEEDEAAVGAAAAEVEDGRDLLARVRGHAAAGLVVNLAPSGFWLVVFFLVPLVVMFVYSFGHRVGFGEVATAFDGLEHLTLEQYSTFFVPDGMTLTRTVTVILLWLLEQALPVGELTAVDPTPYVRLTVRSIWFGTVTTVVAVLVGYPTAYFIARGAPAKYRNWLIFFVVLPYWASYLVRVYAIKVLLAKGGLLATALLWLPWVTEEPTLLFTDFAVEFGLLYIWIPFMILPAYASIENIDFTLHEAAMDLGGDRWDAFFRVTLPLSMPGVIAGSVLIFIPSVGAYVIPALLGGPNSMTIGQFIALQFGPAGNWPLGAAAAFVLMAIMLLIIGGYQRRVGGDLV